MNAPFLRRDEATALLENIDDPTTRNLVQLALGMMTVRALPFHQLGSPTERFAEAPTSPIDLVFFVRLMRICSDSTSCSRGSWLASPSNRHPMGDERYQQHLTPVDSLPSTPAEKTRARLTEFRGRDLVARPMAEPLGCRVPFRAPLYAQGTERGTILTVSFETCPSARPSLRVRFHQPSRRAILWTCEWIPIPLRCSALSRAHPA
jgi:hypothetical protein